MVYCLVKVYNLKELHSKKERKGGKVRRQGGNCGPLILQGLVFTQESQMASQMNACRQEHMGSWQLSLTCRVLLSPFLKGSIADLPTGFNFFPFWSGNIPVPCSDLGESFVAIFIGAMLTSGRPRHRCKDPKTLSLHLAQSFPVGLLAPSWPFFLIC